MKKHVSHIYIPLIAFALLLGIGLFGLIKIYSLSGEVARLNNQLTFIDSKYATSTGILETEISKLNQTFNEELTKQKHSTIILQENLKQQAGTVNTLQKLSKTDPQLLAKYSKVFFLNENYIPERLTEIPVEYKYNSTKAVSIHSDVWPKLKAMIDEANNKGLGISVSSGYRSFTEQKNLKNDYQVTYGAGTANQFSADQGYSEHQLGTTVDFTTTSLRGSIDGLEKTTAYPWLLANAHRYGFVLSYPENNQFYQYEPWHWRYVGVKLATDLKNQGKSFYDLDQRTIDTYLANIFE
jgi:LAS superfamily LD-carboxypeptidase LdcB